MSQQALPTMNVMKHDQFTFLDTEYAQNSFSLAQSYDLGEERPAPIFHYHLPKCAGHTGRLFVFALAISLNKKTVRIPAVYARRWSWDAIPQEFFNNDGFAYEGECYYGMHEHFNKSLELVTSIRHPLQRVVSEYFFLCKRYERTPSKDDFRSFINIGCDSNVMARWLSGGRASLWIDKDEAVRNLKKFKYVFTIDKVIEGWSYIASHYGTPSLLVLNQNVIRHPYRKVFEEEFEKEIMAANQLDLAVYEQGKEMCDAMLGGGWNEGLPVRETVYGASFRHPVFHLGPMKESASEVKSALKDREWF